MLQGLIQQATEAAGTRISKLRRQVVNAGADDSMRLRGGPTDVA